MERTLIVDDYTYTICCFFFEALLKFKQIEKRMASHTHFALTSVDTLYRWWIVFKNELKCAYDNNDDDNQNDDDDVFCVFIFWSVRCKVQRIIFKVSRYFSHKTFEIAFKVAFIIEPKWSRRRTLESFPMGVAIWVIDMTECAFFLLLSTKSKNPKREN